MSSLFRLTNISGGQIVCDLVGEDNTLRLDNKQTKTIKDIEITPHISNLVKKGLILSEEVQLEESNVTKKNSVQKNSKKVKEE